MRREHRRGTRDRIVAAAVELVRENGISAVSMSALAARAGVSRPTLYQHFPDLEHVLVAWVDGAVSRFRSDLDVVLAQCDEPWERLALYVRAQCGVFAGAPYGLGATHLEAGGPHGPRLSAVLEQRLGEIRLLLRGILDDALGRGQVRADLNSALGADLVFAVVDGVRPHVVSGALDPERATAEVLRLLRSGLS